MTPNKTLKKIGITLVFIISFIWFCSHIQAQTNVSFDSNRTFDMPATNGTFRFFNNGTYESAVLENDTWVFKNLVNLVLTSQSLPQSLPVLKASVQNSNITITSYQQFNGTYGGARISYNVTAGPGTQTFNFGILPRGGEWSVTFQTVALGRVYMDENRDWSVKDDGTITVVGAPANCNVSASYYAPFDYSENHSVAIGTAVAVAITVVVLVAIWGRNRNNESDVTEQVNRQELTENRV